MAQGDTAAVPSQRVRALACVVDALVAQAPTDLPDTQALADATALVAELERLRSVVLTRVADVDTRTLHTLADAPSTGSWLGAQQTSLTRTDVAFARRLAAFSSVAAALEAGTLSVAVATRVLAALVKVRRHLDRPDGLIDSQPAEPTLTAVVVDGVLSLVCQAQAGLADDDPLLTALQDQLESIASSNRSQLDRLTDAFTLLAQHVEPRDLPGALGQLVDALLPNELERRAQDAHDRRGFRMRLKDDGSGWLVTRGDLDLECGELLHTVLTAEIAVDPDNPTDGHRVLETSHTERTLKPHERRAKRIETGSRCQGAGCCRGPGVRLVPHHPDAWATTGTTSFRDSVLFCEQTHAQLHRGRTIRLKDGRSLGPHGWIQDTAA